MTVASIVLPVFALIAIGYVAARSGLLSQAAHRGIAEFSASLAIPALLFKTMATATLPPGSAFAIWFAYFGAAACVWALATATTRLILKRPWLDTASIAMTSVYGNTVMLGIPLCLALYGEAAAAPMAIILAFTSPINWTVATLHHQTAMASRAESVGTLLVRVAAQLARNPIIVAIVAGNLWRIVGLPVPGGLERVLTLLGQAGVPSALVALGAGLVGFKIGGQGPTLATVTILKIVAMPLFALAISIAIGLPPVALGVVVLFAAMPAGANAFLFASKVQRAVNSASGAVALGTAASLATASLIVFFLS